MARGNMTNIPVGALVGALALLLFPIPTWAQANDTAYCVELGDLVLRYTGSPGADGETRPNFAAIEAIENCHKGNTAAGIKVLEQILRSNGFTLPRRTAPA
ncbi:MAG: hypothetical protein A3D94_01060 [Alphaproteobacteria bacterium RIFCSPHIGHO2_12_FULL_66_14]|jgi:hypothetical protein|nr:MAG: hypothetical protein A3D94_01060 [Alphaproteobacteria bacterium RIFCSPHIGHO2_12_FULL_66_14]